MTSSSTTNKNLYLLTSLGRKRTWISRTPRWVPKFGASYTTSMNSLSSGYSWSLHFWRRWSFNKSPSWSATSSRIFWLMDVIFCVWIEIRKFTQLKKKKKRPIKRMLVMRNGGGCEIACVFFLLYTYYCSRIKKYFTKKLQSWVRKWNWKKMT